MNDRPDTVLVVDDDQKLLATLKRTLELAGYGVLTAEDGARAMTLCRTGNPQAMLLDIGLPSASGWDVLEWSTKERPGVPVIMITADGSVEKAVRAIKVGAYDFLEKPIDREALLVRLRNAIEKNRLESERAGLLQALQSQHELLGESAAMTSLKRTIDRVAQTDEKVLIIGESGTGKELVAQALYCRSQRASKPLVKVNCAAIPKELIESELFGHRKGAFTGAGADKEGKFKRAHRGTIFLDEIGDMGLEAQVKVLRTLQDGDIEPVGGEAEHVDVRVIAATNHDLKSDMLERKFRSDLYYRLNTVVLHVPPLRDRIEDIPLLANHFLAQAADKNNRQLLILDESALACMLAYPWPGNVRELEHLAAQLTILATEPTITAADLPPEIAGDSLSGECAEKSDFHAEREKWEREYLRRQLITVDGNVSRLAARLNLDRAGLHRKLRGLGLL